MRNVPSVHEETADDCPISIHPSSLFSAVCSDSWIVIQVSRGLLRLTGMNAAEILGKRIDIVFQTCDLTLSGSAEAVDVGLFSFARAGSRDLTFKVTGCHDDNGWRLQFSDVSALVGACDQLRYRETIWRHAIEAAGHGVWEYNAETDTRFYSDGWRQIRGFPLVGEIHDRLEDWRSRLHPDDVDQVMEHVRAHNAGEVSMFSFEYRERRLDGRWVWILARGRAVAWGPEGTPTRLIGTDIDITKLKEEEALRAKEALDVQQHHIKRLSTAQASAEAAREVARILAAKDTLTGLANRHAFVNDIHDRIVSGRHFAVLLIDLDRFRAISQGLGPAIGDLVIKQIARRVERFAFAGGLVARIDGDEFGIILPDVEGRLAECAANRARGICEAANVPVPLGDIDVEVGTSIGIALFPDHGTDVDTLIRHADIAMFDVKQNGPGSWRAYSECIGRNIEGQLRLAADVRRALLDGRIEPHFQPIVSIASGNILGFEVLARWHHPEFGPISPDRFLPLIDQAGLMNLFTTQMLRRACQAAVGWPASISISINVSANEVCDPMLPGRVLSILDELGYPARRFGIEITEQALVRDVVTAKLVVAELRQAGIRVLLDDFGTGYSGLGYLRELQFDYLKIDRSFIGSLAEQRESVKIVEAILVLARSLNIGTIAEGIEDLATCERLRALGCDIGQGWFFAKALALDDAEQVIFEGLRGGAFDHT